jgi:hypothetical protein
MPLGRAFLDRTSPRCFLSPVAAPVASTVTRSPRAPGPGVWALTRGPLAVACVLVAAGACATQGTVPGRDLASLAGALGQAADGARVVPEDLRWEPSSGAIGDLVSGRRVLFLAQRRGEDTRDVWRARVRVAPDGSVVGVGSAHDLTNTPLGDDHGLVLLGTHAAFATRAYGQEQSVTVLDLDGEGAQNKTTALADRAMAALTNVQRTGATAGVGRIDVTFDSPGRAVALRLDDEGLDLTLFGGDPRQEATATRARVDFARGDLGAAAAGMRADGSIHLPKRFSHWFVDSLRAVSWIGPAPIAWIEDQALAVRDTFRRLTFASHGAETEVAAQADPGPPALDTSESSLEEAHWPPAHIASIWKSPEKGEGEWTAPDLPWIRRVPGIAADAPSPFFETFVRPDQERPYAKVLLVAMDMRQLDLDMEAGVEDPEPLTGPPGAGRIPRDPSIYRRVAAAFNGAFKTDHGHYGMMVHKRVLLPPLPASATVVVLSDGRVGFGTWGASGKVGGIVGVNDDGILSFRQNLDALVDHGVVNPTGRNLWGFTLPGKGAQTERTGLCVTTGGHVVYAWGDDLNATSLAKAMAMAGCDYALHLDMNPYHTGFLFAAIDDFSAKKYKSALLTTAMSIPADRYIQYSPKDFFYAMVHDPTPPPLGASAAPWAADEGTQPPPRWFPGIWTTHVGADVQIVDVEPGRTTWRIRAGVKDARAASPLREIGGDEAKRVVLAAGLGVAPDKRPLGLATDGRLSMALHGGPDLAVLRVAADGALAVERSDDAAPLGPHDDLAELPLLVWDGRRVAEGPSSSPQLRAALGVTAAGRVLFARGSVAASALADALVAAGCVRAVALDRGLHAAAFVDRPATDHPPRARYDESVLYAVGAPLKPRAFRFEAQADGRARPLSVGTTSAR